jgi:hypothetical protein
MGEGEESGQTGYVDFWILARRNALQWGLRLQNSLALSIANGHLLSAMEQTPQIVGGGVKMVENRRFEIPCGQPGPD